MPASAGDTVYIIVEDLAVLERQLVEVLNDRHAVAGMHGVNETYKTSNMHWTRRDAARDIIARAKRRQLFYRKKDIFLTDLIAQESAIANS